MNVKTIARAVTAKYGKGSLVVHHQDGSMSLTVTGDEELYSCPPVDDDALEIVFTCQETGDYYSVPRPFTFAEAKAFCRRHRMTITKRDDEYRVNFIGGNEAAASYTNDLIDALGTARAMRQAQEKRS
jgi:hypothetical protein